MTEVLSPLVKAAFDEDDDVVIAATTLMNGVVNHNNEVLLEQHHETLDKQQEQLDDSFSIPSLFEEDNDEDETMMQQEDAVVEEETVDSSTIPTGTTTPQTIQSTGGLTNLGNTCYMNAAIQALASLEGLERSLRRQAPSRQNAVLYDAWLQLLSSIKQEPTTNPSEFKKVIDAKTPLFVGYRQQDSHEFVTTLVDLLDEEYKPQEEEEKQEEEEERQEETDDSMDCTCTEKQEQHATRPQQTPVSTPLRECSFSQLQVDDIGHLLHGTSSSSSSNNSLNHGPTPQYKLVGGRICPPTPCSGEEKLQTAEMTDACGDAAACSANQETTSSPMDDWFTTRVRTCLTCDSCNYTRHHTETYRHLSLEIEKEGGSVQDGLRKFLAPSSVEIKCEKCFAETATQTMTITKLPKALLLHFKRFLVQIQDNDWTSVTYSKNSSPVDFEDVLEQGSLLDSDYQLKAVVHHIGSSASCGHYLTDANCRNDQWKRFNDSHVSDTVLSNVLEDKTTAYLVLYEMRQQDE